MRHFVYGITGAALTLMFLFMSGVDASPKVCVLGMSVSALVLFAATKYLGDDDD